MNMRLNSIVVSYRNIVVFAIALCVNSFADSPSSDDANVKDNSTISFGNPVQLATLENGNITESSGLAASRHDKNRFWTHNDSGDKPRLFAFDRNGKHLGTSKVQGAKNEDWEDLCIGIVDDRPMMMIADIGDNTKRRTSLQIYLVPEPENPKKDAKVWKTLEFRLSTGPLDCEALAYDPIRKEFLIFEKRGISNRVFSLPLSVGSAGTKSTNLDAVENDHGALPIAQEIAVLEFIPLITGADISYDGKLLVVTNLLQSFLFERRESVSWSTALIASKSTTISMPWRKQGETICFGADGNSIFATSEKKPTPFFEIRRSKKIE